LSGKTTPSSKGEECAKFQKEKNRGGPFLGAPRDQKVVITRRDLGLAGGGKSNRDMCERGDHDDESRKGGIF